MEVRMLKAALVACSSLGVASAISTSSSDKAKYPLFEQTMMEQGGGYQWASYPVTTEAGYKLLLFRLIGDQSGNDIT